MVGNEIKLSREIEIDSVSVKREAMRRRPGDANEQVRLEVE